MNYHGALNIDVVADALWTIAVMGLCCRRINWAFIGRAQPQGLIGVNGAKNFTVSIHG